MKKIVTLIIAVFALQLATAQESITVPLSDPGKQGELIVNIVFGSITVEGYDGKDIIVNATLRDGKRKRKNKNKYGVKRVGSSGLNFTVEEYYNSVTVSSTPPNTVDFTIKVPRNFNLNLSSVNDGTIRVENVSGELAISNTNGDIHLHGISGSVSADAVNSDVKVSFDKVKPDVAMAFSNINGVIDVTFPSDIKADFKMKSDMGDIFSDFDMVSTPAKTNPKKSYKDGNVYKVKVENWVTGAVNGGGPEYLFKSFNGDIVVRVK